MNDKAAGTEQQTAVLANMMNLSSAGEPATQEHELRSTEDAEREAMLHRVVKPAAGDDITTKLPGVAFGTVVKLSDDNNFRGRAQGRSPNSASMLLAVVRSGATGWRIGSMRWVLIDNVSVLSDDERQDFDNDNTPSGGTRKTSKRSKSTTSSTSSTAASDTNETPEADNGNDASSESAVTIAKDDEMNQVVDSPNRTSKRAAKLMGTAPASDKPASKRKQAQQNVAKALAAKKSASKKSAAKKTPAPKRVREFTKEGHDALAAVLRDTFNAARVSWTSEKWATPKRIKFPTPATGGYFVNGGQAWGYVNEADTNGGLGKFWRFHYINSKGVWLMNGALGFDTVDAAKASAKYYIGEGAKHFTVKF